MNQLKIVLLGAGNVAYHLSLALLNAGHRIIQIYNRSEKAGKELAQIAKSDFTANINLIDKKADLYIISVSDYAISELVKLMDISDKNVVHTAGSVASNVFGNSANHGVFYPLQTFSKNRKINFSEIPICIEASNTSFLNILSELANQLSDKVWQINSEQRQQLHLSAVFACNFVNHMYMIAKDLIGNKSIDYQILHPLIKETAIKATVMNPKDAQTGPALRNDIESLKKHIELLSSYPEYEEIYKIISKNIYLKNK